MYAEKKGVEGGQERRNGGRAIEGRGKMGRSRVERKGGRMERGRGTDVHGREGGGGGGKWRGRRVQLVCE